MNIRTPRTVIALCVAWFAYTSPAAAQTSTAPTVTQGLPAGGANAWPVLVTEDSTNTKVKPGDATNKAIRVNCVTGCSGGGGGGVVTGNKTNDAAAPSTDNIGALTALAGSSPPSYTNGRLVLPSVDLGGSLRVLLMNSTVAVTQSGAWTVTANAGTNLNTSALLLESTFGRAQGSATAGQTGPLIQGAVTTAAPTYTNGNSNPLSLTTGGLLRVDASGSANPVPIVGTVASNTNATTTGAVVLPAYANTSAPTYTDGRAVLLSTDLGGSLRTLITNTPSVAQSGTWTVQPGNTQNTTEWLTKPTPRTVSSANNTGTCTSVGTSSTTVLASNASRKAYGFKAPSTNTVVVFCKLGATATTSAVPFEAGSSWSQDQGAVYTGVIDCITASSTSSICVYEFN